ncbi:MAG: urocanate hydratase [Nitrospina sp.]|nr:urocanate hydratase [Nitrospina sp.]
MHKNKTKGNAGSSNKKPLPTKRPLAMGKCPKFAPRASRHLKPRCCNWDVEAALRMLQNSLDDDIAIDWKQLLVYGESGRAARNWKEYHRIIAELKKLKSDQTLCVQSGKPVFIAQTHPEAPRVIIANGNLVPSHATPNTFNQLDLMGLTMDGQMASGSWCYTGPQGILQGAYEVFNACARRHFKTSNLRGKWIFTAGLGSLGETQPLAGTMNEACVLVAEVNAEEAQQQVNDGYLNWVTDSLDQALEWVDKGLYEKKPTSVCIVGNAATVATELLKKKRIPDIVTDQTPAHNLMEYIPEGKNYKWNLWYRDKDPEEYLELSKTTLLKHAHALKALQKKGAIVFDYGNQLQEQAENYGLSMRKKDGTFIFPSFIEEYIRPLFCKGVGPFRWTVLSGLKKDLLAIDKALINAFPKKLALKRWIKQAQHQVNILGLPTRVCWLGYKERAKMGYIINELVKSGKVAAPIVIGRDHIDGGSMAIPSGETKNMLDKSDAIADWPLLNFSLNAVSGASWVSFSQGGGSGTGKSLHAEVVIVADGTNEKGRRLELVLANDSELGIARYADAGYKTAKKVASVNKINLPKR